MWTVAVAPDTVVMRHRSRWAPEPSVGRSPRRRAAVWRGPRARGHQGRRRRSGRRDRRGLRCGPWEYRIRMVSRAQRMARAPRVITDLADYTTADLEALEREHPEWGRLEVIDGALHATGGSAVGDPPPARGPAAVLAAGWSLSALAPGAPRHMVALAARVDPPRPRRVPCRGPPRRRTRLRHGAPGGAGGFERRRPPRSGAQRRRLRRAGRGPPWPCRSVGALSVVVSPRRGRPRRCRRDVAAGGVAAAAPGARRAATA